MPFHFVAAMPVHRLGLLPKPVRDDPRHMIAAMSDIREALTRQLRRARTKHARNRCLVILDWADGLSQENIRRKERLSMPRVGAIIREAVHYFNTHAAQAPDAESLIRSWLALPEPAAGRPRQLGPEIEARLRAARKSASPPSFTQLARELGINRATCYKLLARTDGKINASR